MTKQEYIKKESDKFEPPFMEHPIDMFQSGLTKGLEIAEGFSEWKENNYIKVWNKYCHRHGVLEDIGSHKTTSQLLEIYLTENEKKCRRAHKGISSVYSILTGIFPCHSLRV